MASVHAELITSVYTDLKTELLEELYREEPTSVLVDRRQ